MTTMDQQTNTATVNDMDAAVEAQMGKIMTELGDALGVLVTALGVRSGLWAALARAGPLTAAEVLRRVSVNPWSGSGYGPGPPVDT